MDQGLNTGLWQPNVNYLNRSHLLSIHGIPAGVDGLALRSKKKRHIVL